MSLAFDPRRVPFSRFGSYLSINHLWEWGITARKPPGWYLRSVRNASEVCRLIARRGEVEQSFEARATAGRLTFDVQGGGTIEFCFHNDDTLRVRVHGCVLELEFLMAEYGQAFAFQTDIHVMTNPASEHFLCRRLHGSLAHRIEWTHALAKDEVHRVTLTAGLDGDTEFFVHARVTVPTPPTTLPDFEADVARVDNEFARFLRPFPDVHPDWRPGAALASYVLWTSTVAPEGFFRRSAVLMSKNWMIRVWSWDHCFTALGLARAHPELAWHQLMLPFDLQDETGLLPDCTSPRSVSWLGTKSPIQGWALRRLMRLGLYTADHWREIYGPLSRWVRYWLRDRDLEATGLPFYLHGNEQFDNTTLFQGHAPYRSADLAGYLVIAQEVLAELAERLGQPAEAAGWKNDAVALLEKIVPSLWRGKRFVTPRLGDGFCAEGDCLFRYTPLVLGSRLPSQVTDVLVSDLREEGRFLTRFGTLASEALTSPFYEPNSYVRGPIWAPPNLLIHGGLRELGQVAAADKIRNGFLRLCTDHGMHENFHAETGIGRGDPAYTWTAGAYLALAQG